jgi:hypothetical protein
MRASTIARRSAAALLIFGATTSCRTSDANAPLVTCDGPLTGMTIQLSDNQPTSFSWSPRCSIGGIIVETNGTTAPGADTWIVHDPNGRIAAPVSYGVVPENATEVLSPVPLVTGSKYRIHLIDGSGLELFASDFTQ